MIPAGLDALMTAYRNGSQAMRVARGNRAFAAAWRARDQVAAQIVAMTGHRAEVYL